MYTSLSFAACENHASDDYQTENVPQGLLERIRLWRDGKTKYEWNRRRLVSSKQETRLARAGIPSRLRDGEDVKLSFALSLEVLKCYQ